MIENPMVGADATDASRPGTRSFAITPDNDNDLNLGTRWLYVGGTGDITLSLVDDNDGDTVTLKAVPVGTTLRIAAKRILATGTTATFLVGFA